jgi:Tol biopolymer transport system component
MKGTLLGPYRVDDKLGEGGMGEVYAATDTRLGREVAIKILPEEFAVDPDRLARFEREARAAAALNHPHIAAVYDIGLEGSTHFMVQELLQGQTLQDRIAAGKIPPSAALQYAIEIAEALGAAHAAGIAHRDLKPANVFVTRQDHAKVLDFGLAKLTEKAVRGDGSATQSPTVLATSTGQIMGTAGYMAPEQITGEDVDTRADIFAFGCLLFEMLTGQRAFGGKNLPEVLHRIANESPTSPSSVNPSVGPDLDRLVAKCLAKEPSRRYQGAADLAVDLREIASAPETAAPEPTAPAASEPRARAGLGFVAAAAAGGLLAGMILYGAFGPAEPQIPDGDPLHMPLRGVAGLDTENWDQMALAPDGRHIAFATRRGPAQLWSLAEAGSLRSVPETEGARVPFFSPDGHWLGYQGSDSRLYRVPVAGGRPQPFTETLGTPIGGVTWRPDDSFLIRTAYEHPLMLMASLSAPLDSLLAIDREAGEAGMGPGRLLPDGEQLLYSFWDDRWRIAVRSLASGDRTVLTQGYGARYVPTGHLVWILAQQMMAATFDPETLEMGDPVQLLTAVSAAPGWGRPGYDFNADGTLLYLQAPENRTQDLIRIEEDGSRSVIRPGDREFTYLSVSPDGRFIGLAVLTVDGDTQVWSYDQERDDLVPIAQQEGWDQFPFFLPDGRIGFVTERNLGGDLMVRDADGLGPEADYLRADQYLNQPDVSTAGDVLAGIVPQAGGARQIWVYPRDDRENPIRLVDDPGVVEQANFSPDGRFVTYSSELSGRPEVYVIAYPPEPDGTRWKVTTAGGAQPQWTEDGRYIFFYNADAIWRVRVPGAAPFRTGAPTRFADYRGRPYAWATGPDGSYVIIAEELDPPQPTLVLNWFTELERRLPTR